MPSGILVFALRTTLLFLSFSGLCAASRSLLKLHRCIAPAFAAGTVITVLMLSGMAGMLNVGLIALYAAGFAGLIYAYCIRKLRPDFQMMGLFAALAVYLFWRLHSAALFLEDDFSHWGLVARHILETGAFPDASAKLISFQSYPLGATSFIYYVCRALGSSEGMWLIAQNLLSALLILPVFAHVGGNKKALAPVAAAAFLVLFKSSRPLTTLCVDWLLSYAGIAMIAVMAYYRNKPAKALWAAMPVMLACVWFKSSGIFFAVCACMFLCRFSGTARRAKLIPAAAFAASFGAFMLWNLHVKLRFTAGLATKHAVSLSAYAREISEKSLSLMIAIARRMASAWLHPAGYQVFALLFALFCLVILLLCSRKPGLRAACTGAWKSLVACAAVYAVWLMMLYVMYLVSMPAKEARNIAAFARYNSTGLLYATGLAMIVLLRLFSHAAFAPSRRFSAACCLVAALALVAAPLLQLDMARWKLNGFYEDLTVRDNAYVEILEAPAKLLRENDLPEKDGSFIVYVGAHDSTNPHSLACHHAKYIYQTTQLAMIMRKTTPDVADAPWLYRTIPESLWLADPAEKMAEIIDQCNAVLLYEEDPTFLKHLDAALASCSRDVPVICAYP